MKEATMLTIKAVETLKQGQTVWDTGRGSVAGFGVRRQLKRPSYFLKYRVNGRQRWLTIGLHGAPWTPDMARDEAHRLLGDVAKGLDPAAVKGAIRKAPIVAELIDQYLAAARSGKLLTGRGRAKKPSTLVTDAYRLAAHVIPNLGHIKVNAVSRHDIEKLRDGLMDAGSGAARTLGLVGAVFQFAVKKGLRTDNPVRGIDRPADGKRTRRLSDDEFNALGSVLKSDSPGIWPLAMAATKFLALSGWRLGEAANLQWCEIDLATRTALLSDTKTGASAPERGRRVDLDRVAYLLLIYDRVCKTTPDLAAVPKIAAIGIDANAPGKYGLSIEAIEKHIRRLVKDRERRRATTRETYENLRKLKF
jgi:integrase